MLLERTRTLLKEILVIAGIFAALSGAYVGLAYAERYRALTGAHLAQSKEIIRVLNQRVPPVQEPTGE